METNENGLEPASQQNQPKGDLTMKSIYYFIYFKDGVTYFRGSNGSTGGDPRRTPGQLGEYLKELGSKAGLVVDYEISGSQKYNYKEI